VKTLAEYLDLAAVAHGHLVCRTGLGRAAWQCSVCERLGIEDPIADRKRIVTYVEIDRCVTDAVALVANCRLGKRALKFRDWGKVAATFVDLQTGRAVRIAAKESSASKSLKICSQICRKTPANRRPTRRCSDEVLFDKKWVKVASSA
jgi:formylmethanofuran dehydrogenase subunit E